MNSSCATGAKALYRHTDTGTSATAQSLSFHLMFARETLSVLNFSHRWMSICGVLLRTLNVIIKYFTPLQGTVRNLEARNNQRSPISPSIKRSLNYRSSVVRCMRSAFATDRKKFIRPSVRNCESENFEEPTPDKHGASERLRGQCVRVPTHHIILLKLRINTTRDGVCYEYPSSESFSQQSRRTASLRFPAEIESPCRTDNCNSRSR